MREQFRERPAGWTLGAIGAACHCYLIAAMLDAGSDDDDREDQQHDAPITPQIRKLEKETHPSLFKRFQETQAYHRIETEAFTLSNRLVDERHKPPRKCCCRRRFD